tara:strand:- start:7168 stop:7371 length:204 start_codon:yes stop_codon:yes gene_type:complete
MPLDAQESVISLMGFLMAAAIIGAFELLYGRLTITPLESTNNRGKMGFQWRLPQLVTRPTQVQYINT